MPQVDGIYRAEVVSNSDPNDWARVKIKVHPFFDDIPDADLPWAAPMFPAHWVLIPEEGDWVWIFFEAGDPAKPVYLGMAPGKTQLLHSDVKKATLQSPGGHKVELDDDADTVIIEHAKWAGSGGTQGYRMELGKDTLKISLAPGVVMEIVGTDVFAKGGVVHAGMLCPISGSPIQPGSALLKVGMEAPGG